MRTYTVQLGFADYCANTVTVRASSLDEALDKAIPAAAADPDWKRLDHAGPTFVDAVSLHPDDAWTDPLPIPDRFTEAAATHGDRLLDRHSADEIARLADRDGTSIGATIRAAVDHYCAMRDRKPPQPAQGAVPETPRPPSGAVKAKP